MMVMVINKAGNYISHFHTIIHLQNGNCGRVMVKMYCVDSQVLIENFQSRVRFGMGWFVLFALIPCTLFSYLSFAR
jgi:hypothetical protein